MEWIKATDKIPEHTDELILYYDGTVFCAWFDDKKKYFVIDNDSTIVYPDEENVYWMPLPDKPQPSFRLPTIEEFKELNSHFSRWDKKKKGLEFQNKSGKILFLPAKGFYSNLHKTIYTYKNTYGAYWSSTENKTNNSLVHYFNFYPNSRCMDNCAGANGLSVRLVSDKPFEGGIKFGNIYWKSENEEGHFKLEEALEKWK